MWHHTPSNQYMTAGSPWVDETGTQHPSSWVLWSADEKAAHGLVYRKPDPEPDGRLYDWYRDYDGSVNKTPKAMDVVKRDLLANKNASQYSFLARTDWVYVRLADVGVAVPVQIKAYRDAVRAAAAVQTEAINKATTVDEMAAVLASEVMQWPSGDIK